VMQFFAVPALTVECLVALAVAALGAVRISPIDQRAGRVLMVGGVAYVTGVAAGPAVELAVVGAYYLHTGGGAATQTPDFMMFAGGGLLLGSLLASIGRLVGMSLVAYGALRLAAQVPSSHHERADGRGR